MFRYGKPQLLTVAALAVSALIMLAAISWYAHRWGGMSGFVPAMDHCAFLFCDFRDFFYPMGSKVSADVSPIQGFLYSAFAAMLFYPVSQLSPESAMAWWMACQVAMGVALWLLGCALAARGRPGYIVLGALLSIIAIPTLHNFIWGQVSGFLVLCVVASFFAYQRDRRALAAVLLAVAASIKYYPGLLVLYYVVRRDWRSLGIFAASVFVFFFLVPFLLLGWDNWLLFHHEASASLTDVYWVSQDSNSQYVRFVIMRLLGGGILSDNVHRLLIGVGIAVACANTGLLWLMQRRKLENKVALSAACLFLTLPFLVVTSWPHYFTYLPFCQLALLAALPALWRRRRGAATVLYAVCAYSVVLSSIFWFSLFPGYEEYSRMAMLFFSNALLLAALYALTLLSERETNY